jgi:hypothetical protein
MLRQALKSLPLLGGHAVSPATLLEAACIEPTLRAEEVDVAGFVHLTNTWLALAGAAVPQASPSR